MHDSESLLVRIVLVCKYLLDARAFEALLESHDHFEVVCLTTSLDTALDACRRLKADVVLIHDQAGEEPVEKPFLPLLERRVVRGILHLSRTDSPVRRMPPQPHFKRLSCNASIGELEKSVRELAGIPASAALKSKNRKSGNPGRRRARSPSVLNLLTERQIQVLRLIASGMSVKDTAESLGLAPSTVDNHKSRLMKRLDIHKTSELTRLAIREGLIDL